MFALTILCATVAAFIQIGAARPVWRSRVGAGLVKRGESGPKIGGANFPDPSIIGVNGIWYAFATRTKGSSIHVQVAQSSDYATWSIVKNSDGSQKDALPNLPAWVNAASSNTWGPDVSKLASLPTSHTRFRPLISIEKDDGTFVMYFSASTNQDTSKHCVGAAKATSITGPYTPTSSSALICPLSDGGAIDASGYNDNGKRYITWKVDGNSIGHGGACGNTVAPIVPTPIKVQALANDGVTLQGSATTILDNNGAADEGIVEAPSLARYGSSWVLFFSGSCFTGSGYNVNYATASSITGPYTRAASPLFQTGQYGLTAPGGADVDHDGRHMLFHANQGSGRATWQAQVKFSGNTVSLI